MEYVVIGYDDCVCLVQEVKYVLLGECVEVLVICRQQGLCLGLERGSLIGFS